MSELYQYYFQNPTNDWMKDVYGKEVFDALIPLDYEDDFIKINGFITKPEACRPTRSGENYFINSRFVKNEFTKI